MFFFFYGIAIIYFLLFSFFVPKRTAHQDQNCRVDPYLEEIKAKFQQDLLRGFGERNILPRL